MVSVGLSQQHEQERPFRRNYRHWGWVCVALLGLVTGCSSPTTTARVQLKTEVLDSMRTYESVYLLQPGDQIDVSVYRHPELSRKLPVRPDGHISLPLIERDLRASSKSTRDLSNEIAALLGTRIRNPQVSVMVENAQEAVVFVVGESVAPRSVTLRQAKTVAQAIALAGPLPKAASLANVSVIRVNPAGQLQAYSIDSPAASQPEVYMALNNIRLQPNDLIVIPESYRGQVMRAVQDINVLVSPYLQLRVVQVLSQ